MDLYNKICFAYAVKDKYQITKEELATPAELFTDIAKGSIHSIYVTLGLLVTNHRKIFINVRVHRLGMLDEDEPMAEGGFENLRANIFTSGQGVFLTALKVEKVLFDETGLYEIVVKILPGDENGMHMDDPIDIHSSYFYVALKED